MDESFDRARRPAVCGPAAVGLDRENTAHLLPPMRPDLARYGIARCGYPAEYLTILPGLDWSRLAPGEHCPHCHADAQPSDAPPGRHDPAALILDRPPNPPCRERSDT